MAWKNYKPPSGIPASGIPARGKWDDWTSETAPIGRGVLIDAERQPPPDHKRIGRMEAREYREQLKARRMKALAIIDKLFDKALGEDATIQDLVAADRRIEINDSRIDGQAKQVVETQADTRTEEEIIAAIEQRKRELGQ